ncbi:MAG: HD domain-containing protein [Anaerolineales bacterium]|nr:HD domain-containing protein [Anaerolineales bacterium]
MAENKKQAFSLLSALGAPARLQLHVILVSEASDVLIEEWQRLQLSFDRELVETGVILHDIGKIVYPEELDKPGHNHEDAGEQLLLEQGIAPVIARVCRSHAQWQHLSCSFEELTVALADKLWKGKRETELELRIIDEIAAQLELDRWDLFTILDSLFESITADAGNRICRSVNS